MSGTIRVLHMEPDLEIGGGQQLDLRIILAMKSLQDDARSLAQRFEHIVCGVTAGGAMEEYFRGAGAETITLNVHGLLGLARGVLRLRRLCIERRVDLIHVNTRIDHAYGQLTAMLCRLPVVNTVHAGPRGIIANLGRTQRVPFAARLRQSLRDWLMRRTTRQFVAVSEPLRLAWSPYVRYLGMRDEQITVITPGVEASSFRSDPETIRALRIRIVGDDAWPVLMNVARLVAGKGLEHLPVMMKTVVGRYPDAKLVLVGDGKLRLLIEAAVHDVGLASNVVLLGQRHDVPMLVQACDLFVFPSHSEGFGLVALEAMAAGKPIVAFDLPALKEYVEPTCGILVPLADETAFVGAVLQLLGDRERMATMGEQARRIVEERFSMRRQAEKLAGVYRAVLGRKGG